MTNAAINVEGLWKQYALGSGEAYHSTLYDLLSRKLRSAAGQSAVEGKAAQTRQFWALRDLSFEVQPGEVVGVVGRNGAGKSTLLKVLSRITAPTRGRVRIKGRLASLLEVGTGFHPELSGWENIYLNGAILGMSRREVARKFDEIVAFAEIERFLDTPVKRYSSGMYVRLAFAIAAHLEPDVLVVDEVLAVGDAQFQQKCLGKLGDIRKEGRTIFLVSHNAAAIKRLCTSAILLREGSIVMKAPTAETLAEYMREADVAATSPLNVRADRTGSQAAYVTGYWIESHAGQRIDNITEGQAVQVSFSYRSSIEQDVFVAFDLQDASGDTIVNCNTADYSSQPVRICKGEGVLTCDIPHFSLRAGRYMGNVFMSSSSEVLDWVRSALCITVVEDEMVAHDRYARETKIVMRNSWSAQQSAATANGVRAETVDS